MPQLNKRQKAAVQYIDGPLLVLAGAGSGKTRVITQKISYLVKECGYKALNIAAVTFTNKAAKEMKKRVSEMLSGKEAYGLKVSTFHTLGLNLLKREFQQVDLRKGFSIADTSDTQAIIKEIISTSGASDMDIIKQIQWKISAWKNDFIFPQKAIDIAEEPQEKFAAGIYEQYQKTLRTYNSVDFDDLIFLPVSILKNNPKTLEHWQNKLRYLLVDECQDTNQCQYDFIKLLVGHRGCLTVVGDDDQSIYAWRGARPENLGTLEQDFSGLKVIKLEQNYRSMLRILNTANVLIANNPHQYEKKLWSELGHGDPILIIRCRNEEHEAEQVVNELLSHKFQNRTSFRDYAVLYRSNYQSRLIEKIFREHRVAYFMSGGSSFFDAAEIKDIMAYLRILGNPDDDMAFLRVINTPRREIGINTIEKLANYAKTRNCSLYNASLEIGLQQALPDKAYKNITQFTEWLSRVRDHAENANITTALREMIIDIRYEDWLKDTSPDLRNAEKRMDNVNELLDWIDNIQKNDDDEKNLSELANHLSLINMLEKQGEENADDSVSMMTLHAVKGLEFPHVFIIGMEEEILPHKNSMSEESLEEERRLAYVGITRAQRSLTFTYAAKRRKYGEIIECEPSRFLDELPKEDIEWRGHTINNNPEEEKERGHAHLANIKDLLNG